MTIAREFAITAHGSQKYGDQPYVVHLEHAQRVLAQTSFKENSVIQTALWLHDVAEDTSTSLEEIKTHFGAAVSDAVRRVTDEPGATRAERKKLTYPKIKGHLEATVVKLCDRIANVEASFKDVEKLAKYSKEQAEFEAAVRVLGIADELWDQLNALLKR